MINFANSKAWNFMSYDQGLLEKFYRRPPNSIRQSNHETISNSVSNLNISIEEFKTKGDRLWDSFDDNLYNARGFMKFNKGQLHAHPPIVWHWHGFKPYDVQCWLEQLQNGNWHLKDDIRSLIQHSKRRGCRGLVNHRMSFPECSLHLYLLLYSSYQRLLVIANQLLSDFMRHHIPDELRFSLHEGEQSDSSSSISSQYEQSKGEEGIRGLQHQFGGKKESSSSTLSNQSYNTTATSSITVGRRGTSSRDGS
mmetsp:Transcript_6164/g.7886  ORF Transcript_6164/g.7886 Transcript_6164/m.7886 type:complete len:252 (-) Transcript_6164:241-996(-)